MIIGTSVITIITIATIYNILDNNAVVVLRVSPAVDEMDQADEELRETIRHIWPLQARKILDLLIPKSDCGFSRL